LITNVVKRSDKMPNKKNSKNKKKSEKVENKKQSKEITQKSTKKVVKPQPPTLDLKTEHDIAMDFAVKVYKKFDKIIKSVVLFGSTAKKTQTKGSDIDIIIIIDDASIRWDQELIAWYREELEKIILENPYKSSLHINTAKLTTWWEDLINGEPLVQNILRYGEPMIDMAGFFTPLKHLLAQGKIKATPEAAYSALQRAPGHLARSKIAEMGAIEGVYWAMIDSAHAALITAKVSPPSPEHIPGQLKRHFVERKMLKMKYVLWLRDLIELHKKIIHKEISDLKGVEIDTWQERTNEFINEMARLIKETVK
jgi:predicted nucleotidyltransferase